MAMFVKWWCLYAKYGIPPRYKCLLWMLTSTALTKGVTRGWGSHQNDLYSFEGRITYPLNKISPKASSSWRFHKLVTFVILATGRCSRTNYAAGMCDCAYISILWVNTCRYLIACSMCANEVSFSWSDMFCIQAIGSILSSLRDLYQSL